MVDPFWHRMQFAFTITYHYLFPQLTMGLALLIAIMKTLGLRAGGERWNDAARFWIRIFGLNFAMGVVTGIPMEFQFGTNWAAFSRYAGSIIGQTLAMEGLFAFFLESSFLTLLVWGERRMGRIGHWVASLALFAGSWLSGYFIVATNAFMQHPVGHAIGPGGSLVLADFWAFLLNPWAAAQYAHTMVAAVVTGSFVVAAVGAFYALRGVHLEQARAFLSIGTLAGLLASVAVAFPTGDHQAKLVARHQPVALAAMEGRFESGPRAPITLIGQPNVAARRLDNPIHVPAMLSFLAFGTFHSEVAGLDRFSPDVWPDNIELLYYAFHIMAGLGTLMIGLMLIACLAHWRGALIRTRPLLWALTLAFPFPYIANIAGWLTAELGRQPWVVYGLMRTAHGASPSVHPGTALFTLIGFTGLYFVLGLLFMFLIMREIAHGPGSHAPRAIGVGAR
ncbi:MAG TPA: cytochrome ubiquinol oxidase subunit I [Candidatus Eisenbacteria bacterium]|nr:cytochrome ubiquinol oxidase subunit I [Candidatus Eisenbacteria bacterium]